MVRRSVVGVVAAAAVSIVLVGCSGGASPSPAGSQAAVVPSITTPSEAAPSQAAPSEAAPSEAGGAEPSTAIPSFSLPSDAKDLEALLPDTLCGDKSTKLSMNGSRFAQSGDTEFSTALAAVGKTVNDVTVAIATATKAECTAVIYRINGVDSGRFQQAVHDLVTKAGGSVSQANLGGKSVDVVTDANGDKSYVYYKGDAAFIAEAKTESNAGSVLQSMP